MCGIAGIWTRPAAPGLRERVSLMCDALAHRGPDDVGIWADSAGEVALGHRRLSIIDLSERGRQPMAGSANRTRITFNGEIYNYLESHRELERQGYRFRSQSDTEVILALYERYGLDFLEHLRGMFAFGLWDSSLSLLILARDRLGKKPLYYSQQPGALFFASEINALARVLPSPPSIDEAALDEYLTCGHVSGQRTIYKEVREVLPGTFIQAREPNSLQASSYWRPRWLPKRRVRFSEAVEECDGLLTDAIRLRLRSDVPLGIFLSGGIDSSLVLAVASQKLAARCKTFTVGFAEQEFDERGLARQVAEHCGAEYHETALSIDIPALLPRIAWHYGEPFGDSSAIPTFLVSEYAARHVKVALTGDGGDEVFGGYRRHLAASVSSPIDKLLPDHARNGIARLLLRSLPVARHPRSALGLLRRFVQCHTDGTVIGLLSWYVDGLTALEKADLYQDAPGAAHGSSAFEDLLLSLSSLGAVDRAMAVDLMWQLPDDLLPKMDIASMAYGLEARSPFLDHVLIDWANTLPESVRLGGLTTKPILRELAKRYLPAAVVRAPKRGFELPLVRLLRGELREIRDDLLLSRHGIMASLFDRSSLELWLRQSQPATAHWAQSVWNLLMLAAWDRYCYGVTPSAAASGAPPNEEKLQLI